MLQSLDALRCSSLVGAKCASAPLSARNRPPRTSVVRSRVLQCAAQAEARRGEFLSLDYRPPQETLDLKAEVLADLDDVTLGLEREFDGSSYDDNWYSSSLSLVKRLEQGIDLFSINMEELTRLTEPYLTDKQRAHLRKVAGRYYLERALNREQLVERCRRIYESEPRLFYDTSKEVTDLLMHFLQMDIDSFQLTKLVGARAEEREAELGLFVSQHPGQTLPDATDLAIADVTLFLEFERELLMLDVLEQHLKAQRGEQQQRQRAVSAEAAIRRLVAGAAALGMAADEAAGIGAVGAGPEHVEAYQRDAAAGREPQALSFSAAEFAAALRRLEEGAQAAGAAEGAAAGAGPGAGGAAEERTARQAAERRRGILEAEAEAEAEWEEGEGPRGREP